MRPLLATDYPTWDDLTNASHTSKMLPFFWVMVDFGVPNYQDITGIYPTFPNTVGESGKSKGIIQSIVLPRETIGNEKQSFSITYSGLRSDLLADILLARQDFLWPSSRYDIGVSFIDMWFYDPVTEIVDPYATYNVCMGLLDGCEVIEAAPNPLITLTFAQSSDWIWDRPHEGRYTDAYQKKRTNPAAAATDRGFEFVEKLQDWELFWAKPKPSKKKGKKHKHGKKRSKE